MERLETKRGAGNVADDALIVATGIHKRYGRKRALTGVDLCGAAGEVMVLPGANGGEMTPCA